MRQIESDEEETTLSPPLSPAQPNSLSQRSGQRELFTLIGPSLDFQEGSVVPAYVPSTFRARTPQLSRGVNFEDYNEYGSRLIPELGPMSQVPIYVIPIKKTMATTDLSRIPINDATTNEETIIDTTEGGEGEASIEGMEDTTTDPDDFES